MRYYMITGRGVPMHFFAPDAGGGSGGGSGGGTIPGAVQNGGGADDKGATDLDPKLFDSFPWDELDDASRATLEKIKAGAVATLQSKQHLTGEFQRVDKLARQFQGDKDRLDAEVKKLRPQPQQNQNDEYIEVLTGELKAAGYKDDEAAQLAPVFANMFKKVGAIQTKALGESLAPMAATVLAGQAQDAFITAQQQDPIGMFQIPEVQQGVWDLVRQRVDKGMETDPLTVLNLAKMVYVDHQVTKAGGSGGGGGGGNNGNPPGILPATPPTMRTGGLFTAGPGGNMIPIVNQPNDPNAPRTNLNDDTRNALVTSFRSMTAGMDLKNLPAIIKPPTATGGRR